MKKVAAFSGLGNDGNERLFVPAKDAVIKSCNCEIIVIVPKIAFLTTDVPLTIRAGEKVDFGRVAEKEIGRLLQKMVELRGMGILTVCQDADKAELRITGWDAQSSDLIRNVDSLLKEMFGFHFIKRENHCKKCDCDIGSLAESLIRVPCGRTAAAAKERLGSGFAQICGDCEQRSSLSKAILYSNSFDGVSSVEIIRAILRELGINSRRLIVIKGHFVFFGPGE